MARWWELRHRVTRQTRRAEEGGLDRELAAGADQQRRCVALIVRKQRRQALAEVSAQRR